MIQVRHLLVKIKAGRGVGVGVILITFYLILLRQSCLIDKGVIHRIDYKSRHPYPWEVLLRARLSVVVDVILESMQLGNHLTMPQT